jgi:hypothetical protein
MLAAILSAGILLLGGAAGAATISTLPSWNGSLSIGAMGEPNSATYGQTFRINPGMDNRLTSATFHVNDLSNPDAVDFALYVYQWTGARITGDALYASSMVTTQGAAGFEAITFNNINVDLAPGDYVAFGSASNFFDGLTGQSEWGITGDDSAYADGTFVFMNNGSDFNMLFTNDWDTTAGFLPTDLAFTIELGNGVSPTPVPEPSTLLLFGAGIAGIGLLKKRLG